MPILGAIALFAAGLGLILFFAERLVKGAVGTSAGFGISPFILSVFFIGFDPENLAVGLVGSLEDMAGIALGSIIGSAMVATGFAFGLTAVLVPMAFAQVPKLILVLPLFAVLLLGLLGLDGELSRTDGLTLLLAFVFSVVFLVWLSRRGQDIRPTREVAETLEQTEPHDKWEYLGLFMLSLFGLVVGSEMLVAGARAIIVHFGFSDTVFGMTILAFLISIEELARELPAALHGRPEISFGNVVGSVLAFFLFNAGIIAMVSPVAVEAQILRFYLPVCFVTVAAVSLLMMTQKIPRWGGGLLVLLYVLFILGGLVG